MFISRRVHILLGLGVLLVASACSQESDDFSSGESQGSGVEKGNEEKSDADGKGETGSSIIKEHETSTNESTVDKPKWVNGTYLTCQWDRVETETDVSFECQATGEDDEALEDGDSLEHNWKVEDPSGNVVEEQSGKSEVKPAFTLASDLIPDSTLVLELSTEEHSTQVDEPVPETLPGFESGDLSTCLLGSEFPEDCLAAEGIEIPAPEVGEHTVFVSSVSYPGSFGGLGVADQNCQALAAAANLEGEWKAILSAPGSAARDRLTINGPVYDVAGNVLAQGAVDFWDGALQRSIELEENGSGANDDVWTGTNPNGTTAANTCNAWSNPNADGMEGESDQTDVDWVSDNDDEGCDNDNRLYCISGQR